MSFVIIGLAPLIIIRVPAGSQILKAMRFAGLFCVANLTRTALVKVALA